MNSITRSIAAGAVLAIAPALIAVGAAGAGHAAPTPATTGPSVSASAHEAVAAPAAGYSHRQNHWANWY